MELFVDADDAAVCFDCSPLCFLVEEVFEEAAGVALADSLSASSPVLAFAAVDGDAVLDSAFATVFFRDAFFVERLERAAPVRLVLELRFTGQSIRDADNITEKN